MGESHVEAEVQRRIAAAKRRAEEQQRVREELAKARRAGLARRHAQKLRALAERGLDLVPRDQFNNTSPAASGC